MLFLNSVWPDSVVLIFFVMLYKCYIHKYIQ